MEKIMICNKCGSNIPEDSAFCQFCGNKIEKSKDVKKRNIAIVILSIVLSISLIANGVLTFSLINEIKSLAESNKLINEYQDKIENLENAKDSISVYDDYIVCTVSDLYNNPIKYQGKKVAVSSWKVICEYQTDTTIGTFYDFLLCDDLTHYEDKSNSKLIPVYKYYTDCIKPYKTPYIGARVFSGAISTEISKTKSKITIYGTFTYNPTLTEGGYISEPHTYNIDVDYYTNN